MTATFNVNIVSATDRMRLDIGDTNIAAALWQDETYQGLLTRYGGSEPRATLAAVEALLMRYGQEPNKVDVVGAVKVEWEERIKMWIALVNRLRSELGLISLGASDNTMRATVMVRSAATGDEYAGV
jgi:hypothetical protein